MLEKLLIFLSFRTDMANQAALDIEREKEKFDSLITWYKLTREDIPNLGTSSVGNSTAPSYASEKGSSTPMSSQPSSHQSGTSSTNGALSGHNGFNYSPVSYKAEIQCSNRLIRFCSMPSKTIRTRTTQCNARVHRSIWMKFAQLWKII